MTEFQYAGVTSEGKPCQGSVRAPDADTARLRLMGQGITPVRISSDAGSDAPSAGGARGLGLKRKDVLLFTREMAHLKQANMPLDRALSMLKETADNERLQTFIGKVEESVRAGKSLHQSLLPFENDLGRQYLVLVRAGETSGSLHVVLKELTVQLEADDKLRNYIIGFTELLQVPETGPLMPRQREYVDHIGSSSSVLLTIVNDILDLATVDAGIMELDITDLPFTDECFDLILCSHVLEHVHDDRSAMRELYRVLAPGGIVVFETPNPENLGGYVRCVAMCLSRRAQTSSERGRRSCSRAICFFWPSRWLSVNASIRAFSAAMRKSGSVTIRMAAGRLSRTS